MASPDTQKSPWVFWIGEVFPEIQCWSYGIPAPLTSLSKILNRIDKGNKDFDKTRWTPRQDLLTKLVSIAQKQGKQFTLQVLYSAFSLRAAITKRDWKAMEASWHIFQWIGNRLRKTKFQCLGKVWTDPLPVEVFISLSVDLHSSYWKTSPRPFLRKLWLWKGDGRRSSILGD